MRFLFTSLLGLLFVAAFLAFFLLSSVLGFVNDPQRLLDSANQSEVRTQVVELSSRYIAEKVAADPSLQRMSVPQLQIIVSGVITEEWVEHSLVQAHAALKGAVHGAENNAVLDLRSTKEALRQAVLHLKEQGASSCEKLLGPEHCANADESRQMIATFEARAADAIDQIEDEISLLGDLQGQDRANAKQLKEAFDSLATMKMLALLLMGLCLAGIVALNSSPLLKTVLVTGILAILSSGVYLLTVAVTNQMASEQLASYTLNEGSKEAQEFGRRLVGDLAENLVSGSTLPVAMIGLVGGIAIAMALIFSRRRS